MKKFSKVLALVATLLLTLTSVGTAVYAEPDPTPTTPPTPGEDSQYEKLAGETTDFTKYLITNKGQVIPTIEFKYEIKPGTAIPAKGGEPAVTEAWIYEGEEYASEAEAKAAADTDQGAASGEGDYSGISHREAKEAVPGDFEVKAGVGEPTFEKDGANDFASFNADGGTDDGCDGKWTEVQTGDTIDATNLTDGKQYSKDKVTISFKNVKFDEPGIYRYIINELPVEGVESIKYDIETNESMKRVLDVYVVDDPDGVLKINGYILHETETDVHTTDEMGSKDENIIESKWAISTDVEKGEPYTKYDTKEKAEEEIRRRQSKPYDNPNYDSDIVAKQKQIDDAKKELGTPDDDASSAADATLYAQLNQAILEQNLGTPQDGPSPDPSETKYANLNYAQAEVDKLVLGNNPTGTLDQALNADPIDQANLVKFGRTALYNRLVTETDAKKITALRTAIDTIDGQLGNENDPASDAANASLYAKLNKAKENVANATRAIQDKQDAVDAKKAEIAQYEVELAALIEKHDGATAVVVEWKLSDKSDHYTNAISVYDLEFGKEVEGNQGSRDKYFKFTLTLSGEKIKAPKDCYRPVEQGETSSITADGTETYKDKDDKIIPSGTQVVAIQIPGTTVTINEADPNASIWTKKPTRTSATNAEYTTEMMTEANDRDDDTNTTGRQLTAKANGKIEWTVYLKDGEYINFKDLPSGITYEVVEDEEDYKKTDGTDKVVTTVGTVYVFNGKEYTTQAAAENAAIKSITVDDPENPQKWIFNGDEYDTLQEAEKAAKAAVTSKTKTHDDPTSGTLDKSVYTGYTNTRNGILPTGVALAATAGLVMLGVGAAGIFVFGKRREEDEEDEYDED